jgi:hypothetical protein
MPILQPPTQAPFHTYDASASGVFGIPKPDHVSVLVRRDGAYIDNPKGFQQPECFVECCVTPPGGETFQVLVSLVFDLPAVTVGGPPATGHLVILFSPIAGVDYEILPFTMGFGDLIVLDDPGANPLIASGGPAFNFPGAIVPAAGGAVQIESEEISFPAPVAAPYAFLGTLQLATAGFITSVGGDTNQVAVATPYEYNFVVP